MTDSGDLDAGDVHPGVLRAYCKAQRVARIDPPVAVAVGDQNSDPTQVVDSVARGRPRREGHDGADRGVVADRERGAASKGMSDEIRRDARVGAFDFAQRPPRIVDLRALVVPAPVAVLERPDREATR